MGWAGLVPVLTTGVGGIPEPAALAAVGDIVVRIIAAISYLSVTLLVGAAVIANAGDLTRAVSEDIRQQPLKTGGFGLGTIVVCVGGYLVVGVIAAGLVERGAPVRVGIVVLVPFVAGVMGGVIAAAVGQLVLGILLLRRFSDDGQPHLWLALVVGTLIVGLTAVLPAGTLIGAVTTVLAIGGVTRRLWTTNDRIGRLRAAVWETS